MATQARQVRLRPADDGDYEAVRRLFAELATGDPLPTAERYRQTLRPHTIVASLEGAVVGYVYGEILGGLGYVRHLAVDPSHRRSGVGRTLMNQAARTFRDAGCTTWCLNVKPDNVPAIRLYEALGFEKVYASKALRCDWQKVPSGGAPPAARVVAPEEDARVEAEFRILPGQFRTAREAGRVLLVVSSGGQDAAACIFDPGFPGAYPFRAETASAAFDLLRAIRPHARPTDPSVDVVIEDQPEIADALLATGALLKLDIVHMRGPLSGDP